MAGGSTQISNSADIGSEGFENLCDKLEEIQEANAAITEMVECCMANAYVGLDPMSGAPLIDVGDATGGSGGNAEVPEEPITSKLGTPLLDIQGNPIVCPAYNAGEGREETWIIGQSDFGANIFCVPGFTYAFALGANPDGPPAGFDYTRLDNPSDPAVAVVGGQPFSCPAPVVPATPLVEECYPGDFFPFVEYVCPAVAPDESMQSTTCGGFTGNGPSAYYNQWQQYFCAYQENQRWYLYVYGAQAVLGLITAIEGQRLYNDILEKQRDMLCDVEDNIADTRACAAALLGSDGESGILKQCQTALLEGHVERIGTINNRNQFACESSTDMWDCYDQTLQPIEKQYAQQFADKLMTMICNGDAGTESLENFSNQLRDCYLKSMMPEIKRQYANILSSVDEPANNLNDWRASVRNKAQALHAHARDTYEPGARTMVPAIQNMSTCMVQRVCELRKTLIECAKLDNDTFRRHYLNEEGEFASRAISQGQIAVRHLRESLDWFQNNSQASLHLHEVAYQHGTSRLNPRLFQNAHTLAPEIVKCFEYFRDNATEYRNWWEEHYKDGEHHWVERQLEFSRELLCVVRDTAHRVDKWGQDDRNHYDLNYRNAEIQTTLDVSTNGWVANHQQSEFYQYWIDCAEQYRKVYDSNFLPFDTFDLQKHIDVYKETNPLHNIVESNDELREIAKDSMAAYRDAISVARDELDTVCRTNDAFDYGIEQAAVAHVRSRLSAAREELMRCSSRYCGGATEEALIRLETEMARAEGAVYAATERWKWQANVFLDDRRFRRKTQLLDRMSAFGQLGTAAEQARIAANDTLLGRMANAIGRGQVYQQYSQDAANRALNGMQSLSREMLDVTRLWQFWPAMALQNEQQALATSQSMFADSLNTIQLGQGWQDRAESAKRNALSVVDRSIDNGLQLTQIGQFHLQQAQQYQQQRQAAAAQDASIAQASVAQGHELHRIAGQKHQAALDASIAAARPGLDTTQVHAGLMNTAIQQENTTTLNALRHLQAGTDSIRLGLNWAEEVGQSFSRQASLAANAGSNLLNLMRHGQNAYTLSLAASETCFRQEHEMLCKAKDYVQDNTRIMQQSLHGGTAGTLNATNSLLQQQGQNVAGGLGAFGNAIDNLIQLNNPTPPIPQGNGLFAGGVGGTSGGFGGF